MTAERAAEPVGIPTERIGRYEVIRKIATGGMAELYLARFHGPGGFEKRCALKRILPQFASDEKFTKMFLNEARVTAMFDHPNLVQIFELGEDDKGQFFIAMELINGLNLRQLLHMCMEKGSVIPPELAAFMIAQALDGLAYAHEFKDPETGQPLNLVHRDISPQNILVSFEGAVKLVDFGIVKGASISSETQAGMLKGKVAYMSPEQASGEQIDARSDLFSLGVCFYELIAGERPFDAANDVMTLKAILEKTPMPLTTFTPTCPVGIEQGVYRALEKYPEHRFQSAREFQVDLQNVLRGCPIPLGRHVVAEFISSLTEDSTATFDTTKLTIPRVVEPTVGAPKLPSAQPYYPPSQFPQGAAGSIPGTPSAPSAPALMERGISSSSQAPAIPPSRTINSASSFSGSNPSGVHLDESALLAAGVRRKNSTGMILTAVASAMVGALIFWTAAPKTELVMIEKVQPEPPKEQPVTPQTPEAPPTETTQAIAAKIPKNGTATENKKPPPKPQPVKTDSTKMGTGKFILETKPSMVVRLKGNRGKAKKLGETPIEVELPVGTHTLLLRRASKHIRRTMTVAIEKDQVVKRQLRLRQGHANIRSRPWAEVYVNGAKIGVTPINNYPLYQGKYSVKWVFQNGQKKTKKVSIRAGSSHDVSARL